MVIRFNLVAPSPNRLTSLDVVHPQIEDGKPVPDDVQVERKAAFKGYFGKLDDVLLTEWPAVEAWMAEA
jgi:hypothetical protein